jgi:putative hydroxymethylpyrimidine transport system substrate-binding protein
MKRARLDRPGALVLAALAATVLAAAGCGSSSSSSPAASSAGNSSTTSSNAAPQSVQVELDWFPNPDHVALYTALSKGYFKQHGLDVTLQAPSNPSDPTKLVAAGKVPLGISYEPEVLIARAHGLPVTAVGALIPVALNSVLATGNQNITTPAGLKGKTIGTAGLPSDHALVTTILHRYGVPTSSVKEVNVSANLLAAMISGSVNATLGGYRNIEAVQLKDRGLNPTVIPVTTAGVPQYDELVIIANSDKLAMDASYRAMVKRFMAGLAQGNNVAETSPAAAQAAIVPVTQGYSKPLVTKMVDATVPLLKNPAGFGHMDPAAWASYSRWMTQQNLLNKAVNGASAVTNAYLPPGG